MPKHIDKHPRCRYAELSPFGAWRKHVRDFFIWLVVGTAALYGVIACTASALK